jgi:sugar phosphate isomerase/epimerase
VSGDLAERLRQRTERLDRIQSDDADDALAELMAIVVEANADLANAPSEADIRGGIGDGVLDRLKEFVAKLREKLADLAGRLGFQSWSIAAGWPVAVTVTVTFGGT